MSDVNCEERSDEAIHSFLLLYGLLRFARNDGLCVFCCLKIESENFASLVAWMSEREIRGQRHVRSRKSRSLSSVAQLMPVDRPGRLHSARQCEMIELR